MVTQTKKPDGFARARQAQAERRAAERETAGRVVTLEARLELLEVRLGELLSVLENLHPPVQSRLADSDHVVSRLELLETGLHRVTNQMTTHVRQVHKLALG